MYAIVEIAGQQFKVAKDQKVYVHRLQGEEGSKVSFDNVLLVDNGSVTIGAPAIEGAAVTAKILSHLKGNKVIVFKKKRRKGFRKKNGHRQSLTQIQIEGIVTSGAKKAAPKKAAVKADKPVAKKAAPKAAAKADDLRKVEGIGPKIAGIFAEAGIDTFAKLGKADVEKLKEILAAAGPRYASKNPTTWPQQAQLAADGQWDELKVLQDNLNGGV